MSLKKKPRNRLNSRVLQKATIDQVKNYYNFTENTQDGKMEI